MMRPAVPAPEQASTGFEGRAQELEQLRALVRRTHEAELSFALIEGDSGVGKSALLSELVRLEHQQTSELLVLSGRCPKHARAPYGAFVGAAHTLAKVLSALPEEGRAVARVEHARLVCELFPVLLTSPLAESSAERAPLDPQRRQRAALRAFADVLGELAQQRQVMLVIRDLQWADPDSLALLRALICEHRPAVFIGCSVLPERDLGAEPRALLAQIRAHPGSESLRLRGLSPPSARELVRKLLPGRTVHTIETVTVEGRGHPLLIAELAHAARTRPETLPRTTLESALAGRIAALEPGAQELLELLALSDAALTPTALASLLAGAVADRARRALLASGLATSTPGHELEPAHDAVRVAAVRRMSDQRRREAQRRLAEQLERRGEVGAEQALRWEEAGELEHALVAYERASEAAYAALAFGVTAQLCQRALWLAGEAMTGLRGRLLIRQGRALAALGRHAQAAPIFAEAADLASGTERLELLSCSARERLRCAQLAPGTAQARAVLEELGMPLASGGASLLGQMWWERARLGLRGLSCAPPREPSATEGAQLEISAALTMPLIWTHPGAARALNLRRLRKALDLGAPADAAHSLAIEALLAGAAGRSEHAATLLELSDNLVADLEAPMVDASLHCARGTLSALAGRAQAALLHFEAAHELTSANEAREPWLGTLARCQLGCALALVGQHQRLVALNNEWEDEAERVGDNFARSAQLSLGGGLFVHLLADDAHAAREALRKALAPWKELPGGVLELGEALARTILACYEGDGDAFRWFIAERRRHEQAPVLRLPAGRTILLICRALAALAAHASSDDRAARLDSLRTDLRELLALSPTQVAGLALEAQLHALEGETEEALRYAERAERSATEQGQAYLAHALRYFRGCLERSEESPKRRQAALRALREQGWKQPWRALSLLMPALHVLDDAASLSSASEALWLGRYQLPGHAEVAGRDALCHAIDTCTGRPVSLYFLSHDAPEALARIKQEFRALRAVCHPSLARLEALFEHPQGLTLVMERIPETSFLEHVRPHDALDEASLRRVLLDLLSACSTLHEAGFAHGDLCPSNLRLSADNRLVVVGRGLKLSGEEAEGEEDGDQVLALAYLAPEQLDASEGSPLADVYAIGACLYTALTRRAPFEHTARARMLEAKRKGRPLPPYAFGCKVAADLEELCLAMLERDPEARPTLSEVRAVLLGELDLIETRRRRRARAATSPTPLSGVLALPHRPFSGRAHELAQIDAVLERVAKGESADRLLLIRGESGLGKTALVHAALGSLQRKHPEVRILRSRCFTNEQLGHQAFDGAVDELARSLRRLTPAELSALLPAHAALLAQLFPVLGSVPAIRKASKKGLPAEPPARLAAAREAFVDLLVALNARRPLVLAIDDLQWADAQSFPLLMQLLVHPRAARLAVVATLRPHEARDELVAAQLAALARAPGVTQLELGQLPLEEARALASELLGEQAGAEQITALVRESGGHPLLMQELGIFFQQNLVLGETLDLERALCARLERLDVAQRELVELLSLVGRPLPMHLLLRAAGSGHELENALAELLRQSLIEQRGAGELVCFHDRLREIAVTELSAERARLLRERLAEALEAEPHSDHAERARLWDAAGRPDEASEAYAAAARAALGALSFASAERLSARAIELSGATSCELLAQRAHALVALGRSLEAAQLFERAAGLSSGPESVRLRVWAAQHQIQGAQFAAGTRNARILLEELGVPLAGGPWAAISRIAWERARLSLRGFAVSPGAVVSSAQRLTLDAMNDLITPLTWAEPLPGQALNARHLRRALEVGEPSHVARALSQEAIFQSFQCAFERCPALLDQADALLTGRDEPAARAMVLYARGAVAAFEGRASHSLAHLLSAEELMTTSCPGELWLLINIRGLLGTTLALVGEHQQLRKHTARWLEDAAARKDRFALATHLGVGLGVLLALMDGAPERALAALEEAMIPWRECPQGPAHLGELMARTVVHSYRGDRDGWAWFEAHRKEHERALAYRPLALREILLTYRSEATLAACVETAVSDRAPLLLALRRDIAGFAGVGVGRITAPQARAQLHVLEGKLEPALKEAIIAHEIAGQLGYVAAGNAIAHLIGLLEGGQGGRERSARALTFFAEQGWKDPARAAASFAPVVRLLAAGESFTHR